MMYMCPALIKDAKEIAGKMLENEEIKPIPFGALKNSVFVTTNPDLITVNKEFELKGRVFYIGYGLKHNGINIDK